MKCYRSLSRGGLTDREVNGSDLYAAFGEFAKSRGANKSETFFVDCVPVKDIDGEVYHSIILKHRSPLDGKARYADIGVFVLSKEEMKMEVRCDIGYGGDVLFLGNLNERMIEEVTDTWVSHVRDEVVKILKRKRDNWPDAGAER